MMRSKNGLWRIGSKSEVEAAKPESQRPIDRVLTEAANSKQGPAFDRGGERAFIEVVELAANRDTQRKTRDLDF